MWFFGPSKLHWKMYVETTWIFRPSKLHPKRYLETARIFRPAKLIRKKNVEMRWKFVEIFSSTYRRNIDVELTSIRRGMTVGILTLVKKLMIKILNLKLVIILEYQSTKTFLLKNILQIGLKKFLSLKILKILFHGHAVSYLNEEKITGTFYGKELQKTTQEEFRIEKVIKKKGDKLYVKWKGYDSSFNNWTDKKDVI